ncbi:hypothetical protein [Geodermatophilus sp. DSM 44513]|uniref:hypothetical protein n=1 Tax=Geodermatophilus sp. DSM 44513 TaxID=1528104 RepID=UPI00127CB6A2|nr:hypothetical protein [Geodermatophilus sp. DSM 44513]WNV74445.1 hypothetical protein RTG05_15820 [Geodermatophilus sp. DSM 44513]
MTDLTQAIAWWQVEPTRLARDQREIEARFPNLTLTLEGQGHWLGVLPMWPFNRPEPPDLSDLLHGTGLKIQLSYSAAYPMVSPYVLPLDPEPLFEELTQTRWHVLGNRALCLFQTQADWDPNSSVIDLLLKAAGWRIEYALLKSGVRTDMTMAGIVYDDSLDDLIAEAAEALAQAQPAEASTDDEPEDDEGGGR